MAFSTQTYTGDGAETTFSVPFAFISRDHVKVFLDGVETTAFTWPTGSTIKFDTAPGAGVTILVDRDTPTGPSALTVFTDGSPTLPAAELNRVLEQAMFVAEEAFDEVTDVLGKDAGALWDAESTRITNVGTPTAAADAATKQYVDAASVAAGNVPTPDDPSDNNKVLQADGGTFDWQAKAVTAAQVSDSTSIGRNLIKAANAAAVRALTTPLTANGDLWARIGGVDARLALGGADGMVLGRSAGALNYFHQGLELVEAVDLTNGSANDLAEVDFAPLVAGYTYLLYVQQVSSTDASWTTGLRFRTAGGSVRTASGDYYSSEGVISGTGSLNTGRTSVLLHHSASTPVIAMNIQAWIFGARSAAARTAVIWDGDITGPNVAARNFGSGNVQTAEDNDLVRFRVNGGTFDNGTAFLYRLREPT